MKVRKMEPYFKIIECIESGNSNLATDILRY